jgi:type VI secretion system secreted protein VgrG
MPMSQDFLFKAGSLEAEDLRVLSFSGTEGMSECFVYDLELATFTEDVEFEDMIGEPAHLTITTPQGDRHVDGLVARWEEVGRGKKAVYYSVRVVPQVWTLTLIRRSRIFQNLATPDILKKVFEDAQIPANSYKLSLNTSYEKRLYCVQYRESDFEFISRLMEEEGIFFFFEHTEDGHVMMIGDASSVHPEVPGKSEFPFYEAESGLEGDEKVTHFRYARSLHTGAVTLREFDFKKPSLKLEATKDAGSDKEDRFVHYDYPGDYHKQALGDRLAKVRLEEERAEVYLGRGESSCRRFEPGYRFTMTDHPRDELNMEYLLVRVLHHGEQPHAGFGAAGGGGAGERPLVYRNEFECIPSTVQYRPARVTPQPRIDGPQTAVVTGPKGSEIHCDEHGRVKVKFHWDLADPKDDTSSCWIRVSQGWGGSGWGMMFIPRVGNEVIVEFLEGDPDRPLITGRVYNGTNAPPYALPDHKTKSTIMTQTTPGGGSANHITLEDASGSQMFHVNASKDMLVTVANDMKTDVVANLTESVGGNRTRTVGGNETITIGGSRLETVKANESLTVNGSRIVTIGGSEVLAVKGSRSEQIGAAAITAIGAADVVAVKSNHTLTVGAILAELIGGAKAVVVKGKISEKATGARAEVVGGAKVIKAKGNITETAGGLIMQMAAGAYNLKAGGDAQIVAANVTVVAGGSITLKAGGSEIKIGSGITMKASSISMEAAGKLTAKGSNIKAN